ncbi:hypothetical protein GCM10012276_26350 [Nocardioides deserti]|nr:hypothetical protein GCM10012276_26350 [Nocardioides deserti]
MGGNSPVKRSCEQGWALAQAGNTQDVSASAHTIRSSDFLSRARSVCTAAPPDPTNARVATPERIAAKRLQENRGQDWLGREFGHPDTRRVTGSAPNGCFTYASATTTDEVPITQNHRGALRTRRAW